MPRTKRQLTTTEYRKYALSLGKFVHIYSKAEGVWHTALRRWSGIDEKVIRALTGGLRGGEVINTTKKVMALSGVPEDIVKEFDILVEQFNAISEFRDRLIHRGADFNEDFSKLVSTNEIYYRTLEDYESVAFNRDDITHASTDLGMIMLRVLLSMLPPEYVWPPDLEKQRKTIYAPWRYKRLTPETPNRPPKAKKSPKREHLRRAWS